MKHAKLYEVVQDLWDKEWYGSYYVSKGDSNGSRTINLVLFLLRLSSEEKHLWSSK